MAFTLSEDERQIIANIVVDWRDDDFDPPYSQQSIQPPAVEHIDTASQATASQQGTQHKDCIPKKYLFGLPSNELHPLLANQPKFWNPRSVDDFDLIGA